MAFTEDATTLNVYLNDFGVSCTSGGTTALGVLSQPQTILAGDQIISTEYELFTLTSNFGALLSGASISVNSVNYKVREVQAEDDGVFCRIMLSKV
tara:strand:+ start:1525 stop:1812 length:288 start_codon:yes stop_codon:yes gene_type:complete